MCTGRNRREFLKRGVTAGAALAIGSISLAGCCGKSCLKSESAAEGDTDFSRLAYCCIDCDTCPLYKATLDNDDKAKTKIAGEWGYAEKPNFELGQFYCYGCKDERSRGIPGRGCTVRSCAVKKGFEICAQCSGFEDCDNDFWRAFPHIRDKVRCIKKELGIT